MDKMEWLEKQVELIRKERFFWLLINYIKQQSPVSNNYIKESFYNLFYSLFLRKVGAMSKRLCSFTH